MKKVKIGDYQIILLCVAPGECLGDAYRKSKEVSSVETMMKSRDKVMKKLTFYQEVLKEM